jgi:transposase
MAENKIKELVNKGMSQIEAMVYILVQSGMTYRELGARLGMSHTKVANWYKAAEEKL